MQGRLADIMDAVSTSMRVLITARQRFIHSVILDFCSSRPLGMSAAEGTSVTGYSVALVTCPSTEAAKKLSR